MAKKKAAKKPAAPAKKSPAKKASKTEIGEAIELNAKQEKALELVQSCDDARKDLEVAVTVAATNAVRDVFKKHKVSLTAAEAADLTVILFGD